MNPALLKDKDRKIHYTLPRRGIIPKIKRINKLPEKYQVVDYHNILDLTLKQALPDYHKMLVEGILPEALKNLGYTPAVLKIMLNNTNHVVFYDMANILNEVGLSMSFSTEPTKLPYINPKKIIKNHPDIKNYFTRKWLGQRKNGVPDFRILKYAELPQDATEDMKEHVLYSMKRYLKEAALDSAGEIRYDGAGHVIYTEKTYPYNLFSNPIRSLLTSAGKSDMLQKLVDNAKLLGTNANTMQDWLDNQNHITWYDMINIFRYAGLKLVVTVVQKSEDDHTESTAAIPSDDTSSDIKRVAEQRA